MKAVAMDRAPQLYYLLYPCPDVARRAECLMRTVVRPQTVLPGLMPAERLHITLQPLGAWDCVTANWAARLLSTLDEAPFDVAFNRLGSRHTNGLGTVELTGAGLRLPGLQRFHRRLCDAMQHSGRPTQLIRQRLRPHMTLHYAHAAVERRAVPPLAWTVDALCLVLSHVGQGRHELLQRQPLARRQRRLEGF